MENNFFYSRNASKAFMLVLIGFAALATSLIYVFGLTALTMFLTVVGLVGGILLGYWAEYRVEKYELKKFLSELERQQKLQDAQKKTPTKKTYTAVVE